MIHFPSPSPQTKRIPGLDGLRGLAVLAVIGFHASVPRWGGGFIGVEVFFVLSGFLITSLIVREWQTDSTVNLKNFYFRRFLRLMPALLVILSTFVIGGSIALAAGAATGSPYTEINQLWIEALLVFFGMANWARALGFYPILLMGHTWSLAIEWQFYLAWPTFLLILLKVTKSPRVIITIILAAALAFWLLRILALQHGASYPRLYNGLDTRLGSLLLGCAIGIAFGFKVVPQWAQSITNREVVGCFLGLAGFGVFAEWKTPFMYYAGFPIVSILSATIVLYLLVHDSKKSFMIRVLEGRWLRGLGVISYGVYLWHYPILRIIETRRWSLPISLAATMVLTLGIAFISYRLVERPMLNLKSKAR